MQVSEEEVSFEMLIKTQDTFGRVQNVSTALVNHTERPLTRSLLKDMGSNGIYGRHSFIFFLLILNSGNVVVSCKEICNHLQSHRTIQQEHGY